MSEHAFLEVELLSQGDDAHRKVIAFVKLPSKVTASVYSHTKRERMFVSTRT